MSAVMGRHPTLGRPMFVVAVVIHHDMDLNPRGDTVVNVLEELQLLLVTMATLALTKH